MNQDKIGKFIKEIRKNNNLTQKDLADKYGVTYQAVSKWENGKNIPDIMLLKQISKDFNVNIEDILDGEVNSNKKKKNNIFIIIGIILIIVIICLFGIFTNKNDDFEFKKITSNCNNFNITGSMAYNDGKSSIYISNINYCGGSDDTLYDKLECVLYESNGNIETRIDEYNYDKEENIKLEDFFKNVTFNVDNYTRSCKEYKENSLYLQINATDDNGKVTTYKVPLSLEENCNNQSWFYYIDGGLYAKKIC